jgi:GNAT superfamily N-acetyltransferase
VPAVLTVRRALPADAEGIAQVHAATGLDAYRGFLPIEALDHPERLQRRIDHWREVLDRLGDQTDDSVEAMWVAADTDDPDTIVGFIHVCPSGDEDAGDEAGEITTFYVSTARQGERIGERLLHRSIDHLLGSGCTDLRLWTLEGNEKAQRYYANRGWTADGATRPVPTDEYEAKEVRFRTDGPSLDAQPPRRSILPMVDALLPHRLDDGRYLADAPGWWGGERVFGGAVVAQVVTAAALAAVQAGGAGETGRAHSLHTHFLRAVHPGAVELRTEPIRIGRTFTTLRVDSVQDGRVAATSIVSFHADEPDVPY